MIPGFSWNQRRRKGCLGAAKGHSSLEEAAARVPTMGARPRVERFRRRLIRRGATSERTVASTSPALRPFSWGFESGSIDHSKHLAPRLLFGGAIGPWCNGSTGDFGSLSPCSNQGGLILIRSTLFPCDGSVHRDSYSTNFRCDDRGHPGRRQGNSHEQRYAEGHA